jgi:predicted HTH transcriptional regulator
VKVERERIVLAALPKLSLDILDMAQTNGKITVQTATQLTQANRNTIKQHLQKLVTARHLIQHGAGRGVWYGLT